MNDIAKTRKRFGLSQEAFASFLECSRSQFAMAETGRAELDVSFSLVMNYMDQLADETDPDTSSLSSALSKEKDAFCNKQVKKN